MTFRTKMILVCTMYIVVFSGPFSLLAAENSSHCEASMNADRIFKSLATGNENALVADVATSIGTLSGNEREVIYLRTLMNLPIDTIASKLHLTREEVTEINAKALGQLRDRHNRQIRSVLFDSWLAGSRGDVLRHYRQAKGLTPRLKETDEYKYIIKPYDQRLAHDTLQYVFDYLQTLRENTRVVYALRYAEDQGIADIEGRTELPNVAALLKQADVYFFSRLSWVTRPFFIRMANWLLDQRVRFLFFDFEHSQRRKDAMKAVRKEAFRLVNLLPRRERNVFLLNAVFGYDNFEIAKYFGVASTEIDAIFQSLPDRICLERDFRIVHLATEN